MYFQKRGLKYSFLYYDDSLKKNVRLRKRETPPIRSDEEARTFCETWDRKYHAIRLRTERKLQWKTKYDDYSKLLEVYAKVQQEEAPNSWQASCHYLKHYVLPFFLEKKALNNMNLWSDSFEEFRDYLIGVAPIKRKKGQASVSYATKKNIIKSLNTFLTTMHRRRVLDRLEKCRYFPESKIRRKSAESVMSDEEQVLILNRLIEIDKTSALFFWISLKTGLRANEMLGLSLADFFPGSVKDERLANALKLHQLSTYGYLALDSQPQNPHEPRGRNKRVLRKPLKNKKTIRYEDGRIVPIFDKQAFNYLVFLWNKQQYLYLDLTYGKDPKDYLLFEGMNKNRYSNALRKAQRGTNYSFTPHDSRHTYSTWLAGVTFGNLMVCQMVLGHSDSKTTAGYVHLNAQIHQNVRLQELMTEPMQFV